jgi:sulfur transfer complex TusBCD TusB component (DsrH family)
MDKLMLINFMSNDIEKLRSLLNNSSDVFQSTIVCVGDAIYHQDSVGNMFPNAKVFVLQDDMLLAGLSTDLSNKVIDYTTWVSLSIENTPVITV